MKNALIYFYGVLLFSYACGQITYEKVGGIEVGKRVNVCEYDSSTNWLLDIEATLQNDSIYLNTNGLPNKIEINTLSIPSNSSLLTLLKTTCSGDSLFLRLPADSFYLALGGSCPTFIKGSDIIKLKIWMRDKLKPMQYFAHKQGFENERITDFITNSKWNGTLDSSTAIYYEYLKKNDGALLPFKKAKFKYVIKTLSDKVIAYSKEEDPLVMDKDDKSILLGIQFLSKKLAVGESVRALLPSSQAFGPEGNSKVGGFIPILVELELIEIVE
jgi:hypothetical protein